MTNKEAIEILYNTPFEAPVNDTLVEQAIEMACEALRKTDTETKKLEEKLV